MGSSDLNLVLGTVVFGFLALLMLRVPVLAESPTVSTRFYNSIDIAGFDSCTWGTGKPAPNHEVERVIRDQVESVLKAKGYTLSEESEECRLTSQAIRHGSFAVGTLLIEVYSEKGGVLAWSGKATDLVNYDSKKLMKKIRKVVKAMFKNFPKARK